jgi:hypothetical protein
VVSHLLAAGAVGLVMLTPARLVTAGDEASVCGGVVGKGAELAGNRILFCITKVCVVTKFVAGGTNCVKVRFEKLGGLISDAIDDNAFLSQLNGL